MNLLLFIPWPFMLWFGQFNLRILLVSALYVDCWSLDIYVPQGS